ncbi:MAG: hypothetical protein ACYTCN_03310 [Planctomycetota bacterium]|jgi:hypothetical protein
MPMDNFNSDKCLLVLARPADSIGAVLAPVFRRCGCSYADCSTVYEVISTLKDVSAGQPAILIVRPAMLSSQAALFMERSFPGLRIIGWVDSNESEADQAILQSTARGMITASHPAQLQKMIHMLFESNTLRPPVLNLDRQEGLERSEPTEYKLTDDEVAALLGVG